MISDPSLWVECDGCNERVWFDFTLILNHDDTPPSWKGDPRFKDWLIDWDGRCGNALCPECKNKEEAK